MSIADRRAELATTITAELTGHKITIDPYKPPHPAPYRGWLEIPQTDREACTWNEVRLTVDCLILVAAERADFERAHDKLAGPLIAAVEAAGGRAVTVQPYTEIVNTKSLYALNARFYTESEA